MPISISDAAAALGFRSRSTLYRLLEQGLLKEWEREGPKGLAVTGAGGSPGQGPEVCASSKQQPQGECGSDGGRPPNPDQRDIGGLPLLAAGDPSGQWVPGCQLLGPAAVVCGSVGDLCHVIEMAAEEVQHGTSRDVSGHLHNPVTTGI
jgi:hypothetical protein